MRSVSYIITVVFSTVILFRAIIMTLKRLYYADGRGTCNVANSEFGASLIPATNSHRTHNVARMSPEDFRERVSRVPAGAARLSLRRLTNENCASRLSPTTHHVKFAIF